MSFIVKYDPKKTKAVFGCIGDSRILKVGESFYSNISSILIISETAYLHKVNSTFYSVRDSLRSALH